MPIRNISTPENVQEGILTTLSQQLLLNDDNGLYQKNIIQDNFTLTNACMNIEVETISTDISMERPLNSDIAIGKNHNILTLEFMVACRDRVEDGKLPSCTINNTNSKYTAVTTAGIQVYNEDSMKLCSKQKEFGEVLLYTENIDLAENRVALIEPREVVDNFEEVNGISGEKEYVHLDGSKYQEKVVLEKEIKHKADLVENQDEINTGKQEIAAETKRKKIRPSLRKTKKNQTWRKIRMKNT
ncbi:hypothetical protein JTB14_028112 [Gonioctena quinquepunctata]|nr:hypothetical protein JTB14_028112 [Gonioctena quinquepunctata]